MHPSYTDKLLRLAALGPHGQTVLEGGSAHITLTSPIECLNHKTTEKIYNLQSAFFFLINWPSQVRNLGIWELEVICTLHLVNAKLAAFQNV